VPGATETVVLRYLAALNDHDPEAATACVTVGFVNEHTATGGVTRVGREAYRAALEEFFERFQQLRYEPEEIIIDGDRAAVAYRLTFTAAREDGRRRAVAIRGMFRFRLDGELIAHRVDYWDSADYERQIGDP
jgi:ketosteroid isomerase-like protein